MKKNQYHPCIYFTTRHGCIERKKNGKMYKQCRMELCSKFNPGD